MEGQFESYVTGDGTGHYLLFAGDGELDISSLRHRVFLPLAHYSSEVVEKIVDLLNEAGEAVYPSAALTQMEQHERELECKIEELEDELDTYKGQESLYEKLTSLKAKQDDLSELMAQMNMEVVKLSAVVAESIEVKGKKAQLVEVKK